MLKRSPIKLTLPKLARQSNVKLVKPVYDWARVIDDYGIVAELMVEA